MDLMQPTAEEKQNDLSLCCNKVERVLIAKLSKDIFSIKMFLLMNVGDQTQQLTPLGQCNTNLSGTTQLQTGTYQTQHSYRQEPIRHNTATDRNLSGTTQLQCTCHSATFGQSCNTRTTSTVTIDVDAPTAAARAIFIVNKEQLDSTMNIP